MMIVAQKMRPGYFRKLKILAEHLNEETPHPSLHKR